MKKYLNYEERMEDRRAGINRQLHELRQFQALLFECDALNKRFHGNALAIAYGLQPWIDALERSLAEFD